MTDAERFMEHAYACKDAGDLQGAEAAYRAAIDASPEWAVPHYDLGLLFKYAGRWAESLELNARAAALDPDDEAAWWNLGIAATAIANWGEARRAWSACGMTPPPGSGPPDFGFGLIPVRLDPDHDAEVVWAKRIDPARATVVSIPLPTSPHNYGAILLTDGAADGVRVVDGREYPVLNMLAVLGASPLRKFIIELASVDAAALEALTKIAELQGGAAEDWGSSTNILCARCSRGVPHEHPDPSSIPAHPHCGLAARDEAHAQAIVDAWLAGTPRADLIRWTESSRASA